MSAQSNSPGTVPSNSPGEALPQHPRRGGSPAGAPRTTVVGSYPVPEWLRAYGSAANLRDAVMVVLKTQELAGVEVISDGELSRYDVNHPETNGMIDYFVGPLEGVSTRLSLEEISRFRRRAEMGFRARPAGVVRGPIGPGTLDLPDAWQEVASLTATPLKFTVTSPYMLARTLLDDHYHDLQTLCMEIAGVLAEQVRSIDAAVVQVDEANLPGRPADGSWAWEPINRVLDAVPTVPALHLCFGNYGGQTIQRGFYRELLPFLNRLHADHLILEFARRGYDELEQFRDLEESIGLGIGVIDIKDNEVESAELVARRIEAAVQVLGERRVRWVHPDCGFWMLPRSVADRKLAALTAGRDLFLGHGR